MTSKKPDARRYADNLEGELNAALLYRAMADAEKDERLAHIYRSLAAVEDKHARFWEEKLRRADPGAKPRKPGLRTRFLAWSARTFGPRAVLPYVAAAERRDRGIYDRQPESSHTSMPAEERSHARVLGRILEAHGGAQGSALARIEGRHRGAGGNALRAGVLGAADGLVSNLSLLMGVAGAGLPRRQILLTGVAGLLAGACSMAIGEWVSVQSSREFNQRQIDIEADELAEAPEEEEEELALIYQAKGLNAAEAKELARRLIADQGKALDTLAREELGIDPQELGGSAYVAAVTSFALFAAGAAIPLAPFFYSDGLSAVHASLLASAAGLFAIGAAITLATGRSPLYSGARQLLFGLAAAAATYGIGHLIGGGAL